MTSSKNFAEVFGIKLGAFRELSDDAATTCSGGASITLFDGNFEGDVTVREENDRDLRNGFLPGFEDKTSSIVVNSGQWKVYDKRGFDDSGPNVVLGVGRYDRNFLRARNLDNNISSIRQVG